jgi:hypothetical protein
LSELAKWVEETYAGVILPITEGSLYAYISGDFNLDYIKHQTISVSGDTIIDNLDASKVFEAADVGEVFEHTPYWSEIFGTEYVVMHSLSLETVLWWSSSLTYGAGAKFYWGSNALPNSQFIQVS